MKIQWLGHACFLMTAEDGTKILTDPFNEQVGYPVPEVRPDIVTVSHGHYDHSAIHLLKGNPRIVNAPGRHKIAGNIVVEGFRTYHDKQQGALRGLNTVYTIAIDGLRVCHLGDLGHLLEDDLVGELGPIDVLCVPVGDHYTIGPEEAVKIVEAVNPAVALPMHYKTDYIDFPIKEAAEFTKYFSHVQKLPELVITPETKPEPIKIVVLELSTGGVSLAGSGRRHHRMASRCHR